MIAILRLGHRLPRDERITTHVALVGRAFGASNIVYTGQHDSGLEDSVVRICEHWGSRFSISYEKNYAKAIKKFKDDGFTVVHLTMYGMPLMEKITDIRSKAKDKKILIVVGSEAVPGEVYSLADFNIAVTSQPHSEVAALAITLDRLMEGKELTREFDNKLQGKVRIEPCENGKKIVEKDTKFV